MNDSDISGVNKRPLHGVYTGNSPYNATQQQIEARLQKIETAFVAKIDSCQSSGIAGAKTVSATPLTVMVISLRLILHCHTTGSSKERAQ